jgi:tRNA (cmo5U34)-methyltransferase
MSTNIEIPDNWTFKKEEVANNFDDHVREQLPWYDLIYEAINHIVRAYLPDNGLLYDIGASTGNMEVMLRPVLDQRHARIVAIDNSPEMALAYKGRELTVANAVDFQYEAFDVGILFLSLMFFPPSSRIGLINTLRGYLNRGGVLIIVDKCVPTGSYAAQVTSKLNLVFKMKAGATPEAILRKELSLIGVQRPIQRAMFLDYGLEWFRLGDFSGWLIEG